MHLSLSIYLYLSISINLSICLSIYHSISIYLFYFYPSIYLSIYLSVFCLSAGLARAGERARRCGEEARARVRRVHLRRRQPSQVGASL